jgi:hypothetical protein
VSNVEVKNAQCWGVAIAGPQFRIDGSNIHDNGALPTCPAPPGAGIYVTKASGPARWAPVISNNTIHHNVGPGLDIAGVWDGELVGNAIRDNSYWAAVSLFGSNWKIHGNQIYHPAFNAPGIPDGNPYFTECSGGPDGAHTAAIMVCQRNDLDNDVSTANDIFDNAAAGWYGILLIGNDEAEPYWAPRNNTVSNNNLLGSYVPCADDFAPGQWGSDQNVWAGCAPAYF